MPVNQIRLSEHFRLQLCSSIMASSFLPQASLMLHRISAQYSPKSLAFSASVSRRTNATALISRISTRPDGLCCPGRGKRFYFFVRAEADAEAGVVVEESGGNLESAESEVVEASSAEEGEESVESEETESASADKPPRQPRVKLGDIMGILNKRAIEASDKERPIPDLRTGDIVEIKLEVPENRKRLSIYKGIIISRQNAGIHTTIRTRRIVAGVGVEIVFPIYSPFIKEIKVVRHRKVRRAKLYYLRDKLPRFSTFK